MDELHLEVPLSQGLLLLSLRVRDRKQWSTVSKDKNTRFCILSEKAEKKSQVT